MPAQKDELLSLIHECRDLGATTHQLAPILHVIYPMPTFDVSRDHFPSQPDDVPAFLD